MRQHTQDHAAVLPVTCLGLLLLFCLWFMNPVGSGAAVIPPNSPKYEIDIASGTVRTYKLIKANSEFHFNIQLRIFRIPRQPVRYVLLGCT
jgi:hypothetical protein